MCDYLNKEKQSRDDDTNNKEDKLQKANKFSCGLVHSVHESWADVLTSFHMLHVIPHVVGLVVLCAVIPIHLLSMHQLIHFSPVREFLVEAQSDFIVRK